MYHEIQTILVDPSKKVRNLGFFEFSDLIETSTFVYLSCIFVLYISGEGGGVQGWEQVELKIETNEAYARPLVLPVPVPPPPHPTRGPHNVVFKVKKLK
jgi:hypothetical protein